LYTRGRVKKSRVGALENASRFDIKKRQGNRKTVKPNSGITKKKWYKNESFKQRLTPDGEKEDAAATPTFLIGLIDKKKKSEEREEKGGVSGVKVHTPVLKEK